MPPKADQAVQDRRLKGIYDFLDLGQPKKALSECDRVLKKHPNTLCAKILKALSLVRLERSVEACLILEEYDVDGRDYDENTLQAFTHCYKEMHRPDLIVRLYQRACTTRPDEANLTLLFFAYVRVWNFKEQQQVALRLYKLTENRPYYLWAIMSLVLQAQQQPEMASKMFLPLAEKMMKKIHDEGVKGYTSSAELNMAYMIAEKLGKHEEVVRLLDSPAAFTTLQKPDILLRYELMQAMLRAGMEEQVMDKAEAMLTENENELDSMWTAWALFFEAAFMIASKKSDEEERTKVIDRLMSLIERMEESHSDLRSPRLAHLEIIGRLQTLLIYDKNKHGDPLKLLLDHATRHHDREVCFTDMAKWLHLLNKTEAKQFEVTLQAVVSAKTDQVANESNGSRDPGSSVALLERIRCFYGIDVPDDLEGKKKRVHRLAVSCLLMAQVRLSHTHLAYISLDALWTAYVKHGDKTSLYQLLLLGEVFSARRSDDAVCRLALMSAYSREAIYSRVVDLSARLDLKMVQRETLGHFTFHTAEHSGRFQDAIFHYTDLSAFYDLTEKEVAEAAVSGYKQGSFPQLEEVTTFASTLRKSAQAAAVDVANRWISSIFALEMVEHAIDTLRGDDEPIKWDLLRDLRDTSTMPTLSEDDKEKLEAAQAASHEELIDLSRARHLLCRVASLVGRGKAESARALLTNLYEHLEHCRVTYPEKQQPSPTLACPAALYLGEWIHGPFLTPPTRLLSAGLELLEADEGLSHADIVKKLPEPAQIEKMYKELLDYCESDGPVNATLGLTAQIRIYSRALQTVAFMRLLLRILEFRLTGDMRQPGGSSQSAQNSATSKKDKTAAQPPAEQQSEPKDLRLARIDTLHLLTATIAKEMAEKLRAKQKKLQKEEEAVLPLVEAHIWGEEWRAHLLSEKQDVDAHILRSYDSSISAMLTTISKLFK